MILDFHTHQLCRNAVVNIDPSVLTGVNSRPIMQRGYYYSVGIHPWNSREATSSALRLLRSLAASPSVVAIGECGLDALAASPSAVHPPSVREEVLAVQAELLRFHVGLSEQLAKPLILHIVKAYPEIIALHKRWKPSQPWIIHGFRGKPQLACELIGHGFYLSFGRKFNPASMMVTPPARLLRETDSPAAPPQS